MLKMYDFLRNSDLSECDVRIFKKSNNRTDCYTREIPSKSFSSAVGPSKAPIPIERLCVNIFKNDQLHICPLCSWSRACVRFDRSGVFATSGVLNARL